jgi:glutathione synthase/RimK-type ligase-like ATP-grasp enzyme
LQLDLSSLEAGRYLLEGDRLTIVGDDGRDVVVDSDSLTRGWIRRLAPTDWRRGHAPGTHEGVVRSAWVALLMAIAHGLHVKWLTDIERLLVAENKFVQYAASRKLGVAVPRSVVAESRERIPVDFGESLIVKPLGPAQFVDEAGISVVLYARELATDATELDALAGAPFLVQERLEAERHLRVVTVRSRVWVCSLDAHDLPVDWRRLDQAHDAFAPTNDHPDVARQAGLLAASLGAGYSSQDWVVAGGRPYFLDLNPSGQWLFLPDPVASAVTDEIAEWLSSRTLRAAEG